MNNTSERMRLRFVIVAQTQRAAADDRCSAFRLELTGGIFEAEVGELTPSASEAKCSSSFVDISYCLWNRVDGFLYSLTLLECECGGAINEGAYMNGAYL